MQEKNHSELTRYTLETLYRKLRMDRERKRIRAVAYRLKKKQRESERETSLQILKKQNTSLRDEIRWLQKEKQQMSANLAKYITLYQQLSAKSYQAHYSMERSEYHMYPGSNETWNTNGWEVDEEQLAIDGPPNNEALLMIQGDNQTANNGDFTNNQGVNSGKTTTHDEELANYMENIL